MVGEASKNTTLTPENWQRWDSNSTAKAQHPLFRHNDEPAHTPAKDVQQDALRFLSVVQPAVEVSDELTVIPGKPACCKARSLQSRS